MSKNQPLSIVIPTLNEAENLPRLLARIDTTMKQANITYEVVLIDDHSSDNTVQVAQNLESYYPVRVQTKRGKRGKAFSLIEGFDLANHSLIAMIDADLQYPPEDLAPMYALLENSKADLIVTSRKQKEVSFIRQLSTKVFNTLFVRALFGVKFDTQSGLKLFRKRILDNVTLKPSPWSFDLEFIVRAIENKYKIASHDITFEERTHGETKVRLLNTTFELAKASVSLRWRTSKSRVREGLRANNRFAKQALGGFATTALTVTLLMTPAQSANALTLPSVQQVVNAPVQLIDSVRNVITPAPNNQEAQPVINNPTPASNTNPSQNNPTSAFTATPATNPTSAAMQPTGNTAITNPQTPATAAQTAPIAIANSETNGEPVFAPVTAAEKNSNAYDTNYPAYVLSNTTTDRLISGAQAAIIAGLLCIVACVAIVFSRIMKRQRLTTN